MRENDLLKPQDKTKKPPSEQRLLSRMQALCARSEHCESDIMKKLQASGIDEEAAARIMQRLIEDRYIDDRRYARAFVKDKARFAKWGRRKIEMALAQRRIPRDCWEEAFAELDDDDSRETLRHLLAAKMRTVKCKSAYDVRNKLIRFAVSRGFELDDILNIVNDVTAPLA